MSKSCTQREHTNAFCFSFFSLSFKSKIVSTHILAGCSFHLKLSRKMRRKKYYSTTKRSKHNCYITTAFQTKKKTFQNASNVSDSHRTIEAKKNYSVVSFSLCFCQFHSNIKSSSTHSNYTDVFIETLLSRSSPCLCSNIHIFFYLNIPKID